MVSNDKATEILDFWDLQGERVTSVRCDDSGGGSNRAFYVGNDFVLKVSSSIDEVHNAVALCSAIKDSDVIMPSLLKTTDGKAYVRDGNLFFYVTQRVHGNRLSARDFYDGDYPTKARLLGKTIGRLHLVLRNIQTQVNDADLYELILKWALPKTEELLSLSDHFCQEYRNVFGSLYSKLPRQIIHRDPNPSNIIVSHDRWCFIDFELSERNLRIYDPCYAALAILIESFNDADGMRPDRWLDIYRHIIIGYDSIVHITNEECTTIPYVIVANQLVSTAWFSEQGDKYAALLETNKYATKWIIRNVSRLRDCPKLPGPSAFDMV